MTQGRQQLVERIGRERSACEKHFMRISGALAGLGLALPMNRSQYESLSEEQVRCVDQFLFRFAKAQDSIGAKLFRYLLTLMEEDSESLPMRDVLDKMERYGVIESVEEWAYMRELRNEISHEYLAEGELEALNELFGKAETLQGIYAKVKEKLEGYLERAP